LKQLTLPVQTQKLLFDPDYFIVLGVSQKPFATVNVTGLSTTIPLGLFLILSQTCFSFNLTSMIK